MSRSLNKAMLIGHVGQDPEIRATASGTRVAKFSLATNRTWKDKAGQEQEATDWHRLTCFGKLADIVEQWVHKGDRIYVEGRIQYSTTEGADGAVKYWTDIVVDQLMMLGGNTPQREEPKAQMYGRPAPVPVPQDNDRDPDDDLPF